ncbi:MAG: hypothetical protein L0Z62_43410 [Gemmataceae bacterium]|nr:hypothetical protein [Gemmataceae bacterium]
MNTQPLPSAPPAPSGPRLLLGILIVGQLVFLTVINVIDMARDARDELPTDTGATIDRIVPGWPKERGHIHDLTDLAYNLSKRWSQASGQLQGWSLFAPNIGRHLVFPAVLLRWDDDPQSVSGLSRSLTPLAAAGPLEAAVLTAAARQFAPVEAAAQTVGHHLTPLASADSLQVVCLRVASTLTNPQVAPVPAQVELRSNNEPEDVNAYFRIGRFRLRRYEGNVSLILRPWSGETNTETTERWQRQIKKHVNKYGDVTHAYMRWRWEQYRLEHPDLPPPREILLVVRRYTIADRNEAPPYWRGPFVNLVARWQPHLTWTANNGPLEGYNPIRQRFEAP